MGHPRVSSAILDYGGGRGRRLTITGRGYQSSPLRVPWAGALPSVLRYRKWGFGVQGVSPRNSPSSPIGNELPDHHLIRERFFRPAAVRTVINRFLNGDDGLESIVKQLLVVTVWHDACCQPPQADRIRLPVAAAAGGWRRLASTDSLP